MQTGISEPAVGWAQVTRLKERLTPYLDRDFWK